MAEASGELAKLTPELIKKLASFAGLELSDDRAEALVPQAEQQFGLMRLLEATDPANLEPMTEVRLTPEGT